MLDLLEEYLALVQRWNPAALESEIVRVAADWGILICQGDNVAAAQFEKTVRELVKPGRIQ